MARSWRAQSAGRENPGRKVRLAWSKVLVFPPGSLVRLFQILCGRSKIVGKSVEFPAQPEAFSRLEHEHG
jgi:hypothetical protein